MYRQSKFVWLVAVLGIWALAMRRSGRPAVAAVVVATMLVAGGFGVVKLIGF